MTVHWSVSMKDQSASSISQSQDEQTRISSGTAGLDKILSGGFPAGHVYLIEGDPGSGKTTLALQFLLEGVARGESVLCVTLSETREELRTVAESHGWSLDGIEIFELRPEHTLKVDEQYTVFHPSEVELQDTSRALLEQFDRVRPTRVVFDSLSELRLLAREPLRYRRQILGLKQYFVSHGSTVLLLDDRTGHHDSEELESISHGVLLLENVPVEYGTERRHLRVVKLRGSQFRGGFHDYIIVTGGLRVFPRLTGREHGLPETPLATVGTGIPGLDELLGGGIDRSTGTLLMGPAGSGKSSVGVKIAATAAERGEKAVIYAFDETISTILARSKGLGIDLQPLLDSGLMRIEPVDPAEMSPGEFVHRLQAAVEGGCRVVMIDSLNGFLQAMPGEKFVLIQLHELLMYLNDRGVITLLVLAQAGLVGGRVEAPIDISYLADTVLLLRYFEFQGRVRRAISAVKRRVSFHEQTIRELEMRSNLIAIGKPITEFSGILSGSLTFTGTVSDLSGNNGR